MDNSERRGTPRAVLLNIRNYVRLAVLNPSFFEVRRRLIRVFRWYSPTFFFFPTFLG